MNTTEILTIVNIAITIIVGIGLVPWKYLWNNQLLNDSHNLQKEMKTLEQSLSEQTTYLQKKGQDEATKENIASITDLVKKVEHQYLNELEEIRKKLESKFLKETAWFEKEKTVIFNFVESTLTFIQVHGESKTNDMDIVHSDLGDLRRKLYFIQGFVKSDAIFENAKSVYNNIFYNLVTELDKIHSIENEKKPKAWDTAYKKFDAAHGELFSTLVESIREYLK